MGYVYVIQNSQNKKIYVGQTTRTIEIRWTEHRNNKDRLLNNDIKKYSKESFTFILTKKIDDDKLDDEETEFINEYNSLYPNGYNIIEGNHNNLSVEKASKGGKSDIGHNLQSQNCKERPLYKNNPVLSNLTIPRGISYFIRNKNNNQYEGFRVRKKGIKSKEFGCSVNSNNILYKFEEAKKYLLNCK